VARQADRHVSAPRSKPAADHPLLALSGSSSRCRLLAVLAFRPRDTRTIAPTAAFNRRSHRDDGVAANIDPNLARPPRDDQVMIVVTRPSRTAAGRSPAVVPAISRAVGLHDARRSARGVHGLEARHVPRSIALAFHTVRRAMVGSCVVEKKEEYGSLPLPTTLRRHVRSYRSLRAGFDFSSGWQSVGGWLTNTYVVRHPTTRIRRVSLSRRTPRILPAWMWTVSVHPRSHSKRSRRFCSGGGHAPTRCSTGSR